MAEENASELDFVTVALAHKLLGRADIEKCRNIIQSEAINGKEPRKIEDVLVEQGILTHEEVWAVYKAQSRMSRDAKQVRERIGGYEVINKIGEGGLGVVYRARQISMGRDVALKVLHTRWIEDQEFLKRFLVEARLVGRLSHQNLIQVFDVGRHKDTYFYSMEFVDGDTLETILERGGAMDVLEALGLIFQMVRAIHYLQRLKIVHRDIKPGNILISRSGVAKLGDFGFVKSNLDSIITSKGEILGTPDYISPEAAKGEEDLDVRSDFYSLGVTFYHMLTGVPPFKGSASEIMEQHIVRELPPIKTANPKLSDSVCKVVDKLTAKDRKDRYAGTRELFEDLEFLRHEEELRARGDDAESVTRALKSERLRVRVLLEERERLQQEAKRLKFYRVATWTLIIALGTLALAALIF